MQRTEVYRDRATAGHLASQPVVDGWSCKSSDVFKMGLAAHHYQASLRRIFMWLCQVTSAWLVARVASRAVWLGSGLRTCRVCLFHLYYFPSQSSLRLIFVIASSLIGLQQPQPLSEQPSFFQRRFPWIIPTFSTITHFACKTTYFRHIKDT